MYDDDHCAICYVNPGGANCRHTKLLRIYARADDENRKLYEFVAQLLGFENDTGPKVVCESCYKKIMFVVKVLKRMIRLLANTTPEEILDSSSESKQNEQSD